MKGKILYTVISAFMLCGTVFAQEDNKPYVEVVSVSGSAQALIPPSTEWIALKEDAVLHSEDSIKTYDNSYAEIAFDEDKIVRIEPNSYVTVLLHENEKLELVSGAVYAAVKKLPPRSSFEIRTPIAMSGARGTDWLTRLDGNDMVVEAYDDMPFVRTIEKDGTFSREEFRIGPGYQTKVPRFGVPGKFTKIPVPEMQAWRQWKAEVTPRVEKAAAVRRSQGKKLGGDVYPKLEPKKLPDILGKRKADTVKTADKSGRTSYLKQGTAATASQSKSKAVLGQMPFRLDSFKSDSTKKDTTGNTSQKKQAPAKVKCCPPSLIKAASRGQSTK